MKKKNRTKNRIVSLFLAFAVALGFAPRLAVSASDKLYATDQKGCILPNSIEPGIFDALEILKYVVGMSNQITRDGIGSRAWNASLITQESISKGEAGIFDALEILKYIVCMDNRIGVNPRPSAPQNLRATAGDRQATITWSPPRSSGNSYIKHYEVSTNGSLWIIVYGTSYVFTGLANNTTYSLQVRAVNNSYTSSPASVSATPKAPIAKPNFWHCDASRVGFFNKKSVLVSAQTIGTASAGFNLSALTDAACAQWQSALGISVSRTASSANADVISYGGRRAAMQAQSGDYSSNWAGLTIGHPTKIADTVNIGGNKQVIQLKDGYVYIIDILDISYLDDYTAGQYNQNTTTHELGHALGYLGHAPTSADVLYWRVTGNTVLSANEKRHLRQVYDYYVK